MREYLISIDEVVERKAPSPWTRYVKVLIDPEELEETPLCLAVFRYEPGQKGPSHSHQKEVEVYLTVKGRGLVRIDNQEYELKPMTALYIPPHKTHQSYNLGNKTWIFIAILVPPTDLSEIKKWEIDTKSVRARN